MGLADSHGLPLALRAESASPAEVKFVEATLAERVVADVPERLIGDKAYDRDRLDQQLMAGYGIEMIAPNKATPSLVGSSKPFLNAPMNHPVSFGIPHSSIVREGFTYC